MRYCKNCHKWWNYTIKNCIFCGNDTEEISEKQYKIIGYTQVNIPSANHKEVPYFNYLLEDENKNKHIIKSYEKYEIGNLIKINED